MPPLYHTLPNQEYDARKSEVVKWLAKNPALIEHLFTVVSNSKDVFYNPETGKWQGVDWEGD